MGAMINSDTPDTNDAAGGGADSATPDTAPGTGRVPDFGKGALPYGRPMQTEFDDGLEYPRIGGVSFRRGTLTPGQSAIWDEHWDRVGTVLSDDMIDVAVAALEATLAAEQDVSEAETVTLAVDGAT